MKLYEIITLIAIIIGPILAVQAEKFLQRNRDTKMRRTNIFKTLMATRGSNLSFAHVEALNRIDLEFSDNKKYQKVIASWKAYFDNLSHRDETREDLNIWSTRNQELLADLLYEMGQSLGYKFDKVLIKRNIYSPIGHLRVEQENELIRKGVLDIINGDTTIPMQIIQDDETIAKQRELQDAAFDYYRQEIEKNNNKGSTTAHSS